MRSSLEAGQRARSVGRCLLVQRVGEALVAHEPGPHDGLLPEARVIGSTPALTTSRLAANLVEKAIRVNSVAPGPVWTPLIPATLDKEKVESFGKQAPMGRAGQPAELAPSYVFLGSQESSYITADVIAVTGDSPIV